MIMMCVYMCVCVCVFIAHLHLFTCQRFPGMYLIIFKSNVNSALIACV